MVARGSSRPRRPLRGVIAHFHWPMGLQTRTVSEGADFGTQLQHDPFESMNGLAEIFVLVLCVQRGIGHLLEALSGAGGGGARLNQRDGGLFHGFEEGTKGFSHSAGHPMFRTATFAAVGASRSNLGRGRGLAPNLTAHASERDGVGILAFWGRHVERIPYRFGLLQG
jgi:hypothetical protein